MTSAAIAYATAIPARWLDITAGVGGSKQQERFTAIQYVESPDSPLPTINACAAIAISAPDVTL